MKTTAQSQAKPRQPAAEPEGKTLPPVGGEFIDNRPEALSQRKLIAAIGNMPAVQRRAEAAIKPNSTGLPDDLKSGIESLSGISMDNVKVHYNSPQPAQLNALAYAQGSDIHVAPGQEKHLPHEAWHVVQQAQERVRPTVQMNDGIPVNDDRSLEREADVMGETALRQGPAPNDPADTRARQLRAAYEANNNDWPNGPVERHDAAPAVVLRGAQSRQALHSPVQRLVVAGADQENVTIASALPAAVAQAGGPVQDWAGANLTGAATVAIVAHGDVSSVDLGGHDYNGQQLAQQLIAKHIEPDSNLLLWACRAGMRRVVHGVSVNGSSLVEETTAGLTGNVDNVTVNGFRGVHMFLPGDDNASRIVDPALTGDNPATEEGWLAAIMALNMHYVYLSGYFSQPYLAAHMAGWQQQDVAIPFGHTRRLWTIGADIFGLHASEQTRAEFMAREQ
ncbi:MAG: DUF4157 domain-containing protein, partial [Betaproteobacteria bacterium]|nr:DUF4157 domain-containing protein [Betaproteobacteria bacterium]